MRRVLATGGLTAVALLSMVTPAGAISVKAADLGVTLSGATKRAHSGDLVGYAVRLRNDGPGVADDVSVTARLSAGLAIVEVSGADCDEIGALVSCGPLRLASGRARTIHILGIVKPSAVGPVRVSARVDSPVPDPDPGDNTASLVTPVGPSTDLGVRLTAPKTASPGGRLALTATVANHGPRAAERATLHLGVRRATFAGSDGDGTPCRVSGRRTHGQFIRCELGPLGPGAQRTLHIELRIDPRARASKSGGDFAATATSGIGDSRPANNTAVTRVRFVAPPPAAAPQMAGLPSPLPELPSPLPELPQTGARPGPLAAAALILITLGGVLLRKGRRPGKRAGSTGGSHRRR